MAKIKYFISYSDLINDNIIDKKIDIYSNELKIMKKYKDGNIRITPILYFKGYAKNFLDYAESFCNNKKGLYLMVELTKEEALKFNPLLIKRYLTSDDKHFEVISSEIKLINYNSFVNMSLKEMNSGNINRIVSLIPSGDKHFEIDLNEDSLNRYKSIYEKRESLAEKRIGCDIYFCTDSESVLDKYKDDLTILREVDDGIYEIINQKLFIIDSIPQTMVNDMSNATFKCLFDFCSNSIPVDIIQKEDDSYDLSLNDGKKGNCFKKGYMFLGTNLNTMIYNKSILPLLKYINIFELVDGKYIKINIEDYMKDKNILKYIKKPNK